MPVDMQRAKRVPVGPAPTDLQRLEAEVLDDGSILVTCFHKPDKAAAAGGPDGAMMAMSIAEPKRYTFQEPTKAASFVMAKLTGRDPGVKPDAPLDDEGLEPPGLQDEGLEGEAPGAAEGAPGAPRAAAAIRNKITPPAPPKEAPPEEEEEAAY